MAHTWPERWPAGFPGDDGPLPVGQGIWFPEANHIPFNPPDYIDWLDHNPWDWRDRDYSPSDIEPGTGLPPRQYQGVEYVPDEWRHTNGNGVPGSGHTLRYNEPAVPHPHGKHRRMAYVWPSDGKRKYTWGRWKDILSSKGPDVFVSKLGDRPSRNQWRNKHMDTTPEDPGHNTHVDMCWAKRRKPYDFRSRSYKWSRPGHIVWRDATWPRRGPDHYKQPLNYKCEHGRWYNMNWSPFGGVVLEGHNGRAPRRRDIFR